MAPGKCGRLWEVDAYREGRLGEKDAASFERHARSCAACGKRLARDERLGQMARELAERDEPSALALRRLRVRVLRDVATGAGAATTGAPSWSGWRRAGAVACVAVLAVVAALAVSRRERVVQNASSARAVEGVATATGATASGPGLVPQVYAGSVAELGEARWTQSRDGNVERVALTAGSVRVHVRPQRPAERFLVTMPDGEIEVRGTTFDVMVVDAATTRVHVDEGVVELRLAGRDQVRLAAGDTWTTPRATPAPVATAPAAGSATAPRASSPTVTAAAAATASANPTALAPAPPADEGEAAYAAAVTLLKGGRNAEAAAALQAFLIAHPQAPQAEDASYLEAVALARAGRVDAAALAAEQHLARFPGSFHRREAEALIARARVSGSR